MAFDRARIARLAVVLVAACGEEPADEALPPPPTIEEILVEQMTVMEETTVVLRRVTDTAPAVKELPALVELWARLDRTTRQCEDIQRVMAYDDELKAEVLQAMGRHGARMQEILGAFHIEDERVWNDPAIASVLRGAR